MNFERFKESIEKFIKSQDEKVILVKGKWGVGKTHYINSSIEEVIDKNIVFEKDLRDKNKIVELITSTVDKTVRFVKNKFTEKHGDKKRSIKYIRISLFGMESITDISHMLSGKLLLYKTNKKFVETFRVINSIPFLSKYFPKKNVDISKMINFTNVVLFIDDIERSSIKLEQIFGYLDQIKANTSFKIIIAVNDERLKESSVELLKYKEKVVDREIRLKSTMDDAISNILEEDDIELAKRIFISLDICNIRAVIKAKRIMNYFVSRCDGLNEENMVCLKTSCLTYSGYYFGLFPNSENKKTLEEIASRTSYYQRHFPFNSLIDSYIDSQVINTPLFRKTLERVINDQHVSDKDNKFKVLTDILESSFSDDHKQVYNICEDMIKNEYLSEQEFLYVSEVFICLGGLVNIDTVRSRLKHHRYNRYTLEQYILIFSDATDVHSYLSNLLDTFINDTEENQKTENDNYSLIKMSIQQLQNVGIEHFSSDFDQFTCEHWYAFLKSKKGLQFVNQYIRQFKEVINSTEINSNLNHAISKLSKDKLQNHRLKKILYIDLTQEQALNSKC